MAISPDVDVRQPGLVAPPGRTRMILVLGLLVALGPLTIDMYLPALPKIAEELSVSSSVAQLTLTGTLAGLAIGQLVIGPLSDSLGRRRPLFAGIVLHMLASLLCLLAPNITVLGVARCLQGMGAAAGMVVAIAVVGDLYKDNVAATVMSRLMLVLGVAPVLAPSFGAAVLLHGSWHWVFAALVVVAGALLVMSVLALPETLPADHRRPLKARGIALTYLELLRDVRFVILVFVGALGMSGLFAYIAGASFVLQGRFGLDQTAFALVFGAGAIALIGTTQFNVVLLKRFAPQQIMVWALVAASVSGAVFVALAAAHIGGLWGFVIPVWAILAAMGLVIPNAPAVALTRHPDAAGTAAALLGAVQFGMGAAIAPVVGVLGNDELAMAVVMAAGVIVALTALLVTGVHRNTAPAAVPGEAVAEPA
ncbi:multidrug effflux MFS transporter [Mycolicibacterium austroafricanum]|uniref:Multidrug effflux MFS transporter n=1 Tax=Mycolicibacterium austroafricanum TaxID=39687 RepID=A0ABT8HJT8_MYCAO|nr:multidrug effflux MFS transporter [Mycolicibacterium austroafricanum]MDN4521029.1 multidrug effflux MFS transporter [Mycolicibacterium austroafricanum]PQP51621.1 Bcr/CflA family drug resistance efflux transporter [Mycolicibacterium austroafricanum]QRZ05528.1 multidrug effflux MFS transporter [Mycolicibacterium austroafricanum]QZT55609.1 multidrug effflux MFS transporter [Mycolicibacterium austroafricanum]QZT67088.1 multidrug effflux MFS transporter [Mycolicibacterium austroafricanum]